MSLLDMAEMKRRIDGAPSHQVGGRLKSANGVLTCSLPAAVGDQCEVRRPGRLPLLAEVIGFAGKTAYLMPYDSAESLGSGLLVVRRGPSLTVPVGMTLLGRIVDALGRPIDGRPAPTGCTPWPVNTPTPPALARARIRRPFVTGLRAIDGLLTCGRGQRLGIFAGSGVGKSTLLGEIAKGSDADVNVIALIGERGREVSPFVEDCLGPRGLARSVVVVATCDQSPLMRVRAAQTTIAIADFYRQRGAHVLVMIDSMTRLAMAQREMGLLLGEPPSSRGYTPSVFHLMATTVERMGNSDRGGITGMLTVLVEGDDMDEPITDAVRSLVDGHIVLDRRIAERGQYPSIDVLRSISRVAIDVADTEHQTAARKVRSILATHAEVQDMIRIGAYARGTSPEIDRAIDLLPIVNRFLKQELNERTDFNTTRRDLIQIAGQWPH